VIESGGNDFVRKPFKETDIFEMIRKHLGVRFIYDEEHQPLNINSDEVNIFSGNLSDSIRNLPNDLILLLEEAVELSDSVMIDDVIDQIRTKDSSLAEALSKLAINFAYERILDSIRKPKTA
jgi:hypothetical protein